MMDKFTAPLIDIILFPSCCSTFNWSCFFDKDDMRTLLKQSLVFKCPFCCKIYSSSRDVFKATSLLNYKMNEINEKLQEYKKSGFFVEAQLSQSCYAFISELIGPYIKLELPFEFNLKSALMHAGTEIGTDRKTSRANMKDFPVNDFLIKGIALRCRKCGQNFPLEIRHINTAKVNCPYCQQSQKLFKKRLRELRSMVGEYLQAISAAHDEGLTVVPFSPFWKFAP